MRNSGSVLINSYTPAQHTSGLGSRLRAANKRQQFKDSQTKVKVFEEHQHPSKNTAQYARCKIHQITPDSLDVKIKKERNLQAVIMVDLLLHRLRKSSDNLIPAVREKLKAFKAQFISGGNTDPKALGDLWKTSDALEAAYVNKTPRDRRYISYAQKLWTALSMCNVLIDISNPKIQASPVRPPRPTMPAPKSPDKIMARVKSSHAQLVAGLSSNDPKKGVRAVNRFFSSYGNPSFESEKRSILGLLTPSQNELVDNIRSYIEYAKNNPFQSGSLTNDQVKYLVLVKVALNTPDVQ